MILALSLSSISATAQHAESPAYQTAIWQAVAEYRAQNYQEARALFRRAHALWPNARTLRGLGLSAFELRDYRETLVYLEQALASDEKPLDGEMRAQVEQLRDRVTAYLAQVRLELEPTDLRILVDASPVTPTVDGRLLLDIGNHTVEFRAPSFASEQRRIEVRGGEVTAWSVSLQGQRTDRAADTNESAPAARADDRTLVKEQERPAASPSRPGRRLRLALGGIGTSLGVTSFIVAGVLSAKRRTLADEFKETLEGSDEYRGAYLDWDGARAAPYGWAAAGSALSTIGGIGFVSAFDIARVPWWVPTLSAALGAGLVSWGVVDVVRGDSCALTFDPRGCADLRERRDRGGIALLSSAPLVALSLTYVVRRALRPKAFPEQAFDLRPEVSAGRLALLLFHRW